MSIIKNFPTGLIVTDESISIQIIPKDRKKYYKNIISYLDEHLYFLFLKATNPDFGINFNFQITQYLRVDVGISIPIILYQRAFPDDELINPIILDLIKLNVEEGIYSVTQNIRDIKEGLS